MDTIAFFFHVYEIINHNVLTKLRAQMTTLIVLTTYGTTRAWQVENFVTHGITDKAPYLSKATMLCLLFLFLLLVSLYN